MPATLEEAVDSIIASLDVRSRKRLLAIPQDDLVLYHHGWGTRIRSEFGLWGRNERLLADCGSPGMRACDASMVVMNAVWNRLHGVPIDEARAGDCELPADYVIETGPRLARGQMRFRSSDQRETERSYSQY